jgi:hypothetical protein
MLAAALATAGGCGNGDRKPVFPVRGKVLCDNQPAARAVVTFHPLGPSGVETGTTTLRPQAIVGEDGSFQLTTYTRNDGAPAGKYAVTVVWRTPSKHGDDNEQDLLPRRYLHPLTSKLNAEVQQGPTETPTFYLSRR